MRVTICHGSHRRVPCMSHRGPAAGPPWVPGAQSWSLAPGATLHHHMGPAQPGCQRARVACSCPGPVRLRPLLSPGRHLRSAPTRRSALCARSRLLWSDAHLPVWLRPPSRRQRPLPVCPGQRGPSGRCNPCSWLHHVRALTWHCLRAVPSACSKGHTCQAALGPSTHRSDLCLASWLTRWHRRAALWMPGRLLLTPLSGGPSWPAWVAASSVATCRSSWRRCPELGSPRTVCCGLLSPVLSGASAPAWGRALIHPEQPASRRAWPCRLRH